VIGGSADQTVRHDGSAWVASDVILNDGTNVGVGGSPLITARLAATSDLARAIYGSTSSEGGQAIYGKNTSSSSPTNSSCGVLGVSNSVGGYGVQGNGGVGVYGYTTFITDDAKGVVGFAPYAGNVTNYGGHFHARGVTGVGVYGLASSTIPGTNYGGYFRSQGTTGRGILGEASSATGPNYGGYFTAAGAGGYGVYARASSSAGPSYGVYGENVSSDGAGVYGATTSSSVDSKAVWGYTAGDGYGVYSDGRFRAIGKSDVPSTHVMESTADLSLGNELLFLKLTAASDDSSEFLECRRGTGADSSKFRVEADGDVFASGTFNGSADFAELIAASSGKTSVEPADVLVIDPARPKAVLRSTEPRSTLVAGVYSTRPGFLGSAEQSDLGPRNLDDIPLAVVGIVPCKASAENGPIRPGDLLVTSSTPGHAMRDDDPKPGTIVGKALDSLPAGTGIIRILVTLQ
jgi:hypothetical protein